MTSIAYIGKASGLVFEQNSESAIKLTPEKLSRTLKLKNLNIKGLELDLGSLNNFHQWRITVHDCKIRFHPL